MRSLLLSTTIVAIVAAQSCPSCEIGCNTTACFDLEANDLTFNCRRVTNSNDDTVNVNVLLVHGWPEWSHHWVPLMEYWDDQNVAVDAVACDMRGYSPGASPDSASDYSYDILQTDVWAIADALGFDTFHLIGHDHGATLGWAVAADKSDGVSGRVLSYSAISVPHLDVFGDALFGDAMVEQQSINSNYFNQFALQNSATVNNEALSQIFAFGGFVDADSFQKSLWWYFGSAGSYFAIPPIVAVTSPQSAGENLVFLIQQAIPLPVSNGSAATVRIGSVSAPTLFVCGSNDAFLLCTLPYVAEQADLIDSTYEVLNAPCGHNLMSCDGDDDTALTVHEKITEHILAVEEDNEDNDSWAVKSVSVASWSLFGCVMCLYTF